MLEACCDYSIFTLVKNDEIVHKMELSFRVWSRRTLNNANKAPELRKGRQKPIFKRNLLSSLPNHWSCRKYELNVKQTHRLGMEQLMTRRAASLSIQNIVLFIVFSYIRPLWVISIPEVILDNSSEIPSKVHYFNICALFRNQARYLSEWISYHSCIGVEHFYLYNDGSVDNYDCVLQPYIESGTVTLFHTHMNNANGPQLQVYSHCLEISTKRGTRWTAFIDIDEFIVWKSEEKLKAIFRDFEEFSAVQLTWVHFASREERVEEEDGLVLETYTSREKSDFNKKSPRKSIVFAKNVSIMHVHHPELVPGSYCTDETRNMYSSCLQVGPVHTSVIYLHHYSTKSYNYFQSRCMS